MALITCKDCKKEFSTDAKRCPQCGAWKPTDWRWLFKCTGIILGLIVLAALLEPESGNNILNSRAAAAETQHTYKIKRLAILCGTEELLDQIYRVTDDQREFEYYLHNGCVGVGTEIENVSVLERKYLKDRVAIYLPGGQRREMWVTDDNLIEQ